MTARADSTSALLPQGFVLARSLGNGTYAVTTPKPRTLNVIGSGPGVTRYRGEAAPVPGPQTALTLVEENARLTREVQRLSGEVEQLRGELARVKASPTEPSKEPVDDAAVRFSLLELD